MAVSPAARTRGLGERLTLDRIAWARAHGLGGLYSLTATAAAFFARYHFERIVRETAPAAISASNQWSVACPASSVAMKLEL